MKNIRIHIHGKYFYFLMIFLPAISIVIKNILFQAFILGNSMYDVDIIEAVRKTSKYWVFYLAITMIILSVSMIIKSDRIKIIYIFCVDISVTILLYADLLYSRSFYTMPSAVNLTMMANISGGGADASEITSLFSGYDLLLLLDFVALIVFVIVFRKKDNNLEKERRYLNYSFGTVFAVSMIVLLIIPAKAVITDNDKQYELIYGANDANSIARHFGALGFHINDIYSLVKERYFPQITDEDADYIEEYYDWNYENNSDDEHYNIFEGKNVIFFQIESLEAFVINHSIDNQEITPNINRMLDNSYYFPAIYEEVQCGNSSDADLMYMTSILPATKGCTFYRYADVSLDSLPKRLGAKGYKSEYFQAIDGKFWNYENALTGMIGIEKFHGAGDYDMSDKLGFTVSDESFLNQTYEYVSRSFKKNSKTYAHIVCNTSHMPFKISNDRVNIKINDEIDDTYLGGYIKSVNYVDEYLGKFIDRLRADDLLDNTVIVIIGDYTGLHKYYEYTLSEYYDEYPWINVNDNYVVPYIIYNPAIEDGYTSDVVGGQIDVMPTLAYTLGIKFEKDDAVMGRNLFTTKRNMALFRNGKVYGQNISKDDERILGNAYRINDVRFPIWSK